MAPRGMHICKKNLQSYYLLPSPPSLPSSLLLHPRPRPLLDAPPSLPRQRAAAPPLPAPSPAAAPGSDSAVHAVPHLWPSPPREGGPGGARGGSTPAPLPPALSPPPRLGPSGGELLQRQVAGPSSRAPVAVATSGGAGARSRKCRARGGGGGAGDGGAGPWLRELGATAAGVDLRWHTTPGSGPWRCEELEAAGAPDRNSARSSGPRRRMCVDGGARQRGSAAAGAARGRAAGC